jgi:hypothetical protein
MLLVSTDLIGEKQFSAGLRHTGQRVNLSHHSFVRVFDKIKKGLAKHVSITLWFFVLYVHCKRYEKIHIFTKNKFVLKIFLGLHAL